MKKYIFVSPRSKTSNVMLKDLKLIKDKDFKCVKDIENKKNKFVMRLFELYHKINFRVELPFKFLWYSMYSLSNIPFNKEDQYYIIMTNGNFHYYGHRYLNRLKKKHNIKYILLFIDPLSSLSSDSMRRNIKNTNFDYKFSFDSEDCIKEKMNHTMCIYSKKEIDRCDFKKNTVYFVGAEKKRLNIINSVWKKLNINGIDCKFSVVNVEKKDQTNSYIIYNEFKDYNEILEEIQKYECILEILQPGQSGVTLRYYEAIVYNKKLITNNKRVKELPFYNEKYMQIFDNPDDIDIDWIKKDVVVDYGYSDEFSPINLIEEIRRICI